MRVDSEVRPRVMDQPSRYIKARPKGAAAGWNDRRYRYRRGPRSPLWVRVAGLAVLGGTIGGLIAIATDDPIEVRVGGVTDGQVLTAADREQLAISIVTAGMGASDVSATLNGNPVELEREGGVLVARPGQLVREGPNELQVKVAGRFLFDDYVLTRKFDAVLAAARLDVPAATLRPTDGDPILLRGLVDDAVSLEVDGAAVAIDGGAFTAQVSPVVAQVVVKATHANGNITERIIQVIDVAPPSTFPETRAVHITARGWKDPELRGAVLDLIAAGKINAVQLDIKDEGGEVGFLSSVELANTTGSQGAQYDPKTVVTELHGLGVRVIGRIVCFLDPIVAQWAWANGRGDMVVQDAGGAAPLNNNYGSAAFTNFANPDVQRYLIDLSITAAKAGFDDILYDYVRRPEGKLSGMTIPGLVRPPEVEIARFVRDARTALSPYGTKLGVSVFGIAASRPQQIAQDMRLLSPHVDYASPMVYPSHWGKGEYGVADPNRQPGDIVERSLADFRDVMAGSGAAIVPWLQAFNSGGVQYGPPMIQAQIDASNRIGGRGFLLWNAKSVYDPAALP